MATYEGSIALIDMREVSQLNTLYTWIKYADDANGTNMSDSPDGKSYMGIAYNKEVPQPSPNPNDYEWSQLKGQDGTRLIKIEYSYAISIDGTTPPVDSVSFSRKEDNTLIPSPPSDPSDPTNLSLLLDNNNHLKIKDDKGTELNFEVTDQGSLSIGAEWSPIIPNVPQGFYLWTKIVSTYSDDTSTVQYMSSYQGKDGERGEDAGHFRLQLNQNEILKFIDKQSNTGTVVSPGTLRISVIKQNIYNPEIYEQVVDLSRKNFSLSLYDTLEGQMYKLNNDEIFTKGIAEIAENSSININLEKMLTEGASGSENAYKVFLEKECILSINYIHEEKNRAGETLSYSLNEYINVRYGITKDMATLQLGVKDIVASIQNSKLIFSADGLSVQNGAFDIRNNNQDKVLYADENGNLIIQGQLQAATGSFSGELRGATGSFSGEITASSGSFRGRIEATDGTFSGTIDAKDGVIGGFTIGQKQLYSKAVFGENSPRLILNGEEGYIQAHDIYLEGIMKISDSITLMKPTELTDSFIEVLRKEDKKEILSLKGDGRIIAGSGNNSIIIDGEKGCIMTSNFSNELGWKISGQHSIFNDVTIRGSLKASVLEYGEVQTVGGIVLIRPSSQILQIEYISQEQEEEIYSKIYLERIEGFNIGDTCLVNKEASDVYEITSVDKNSFEYGKYYIESNGEYIIAEEYSSDNIYYTKWTEISKKCFDIISIDYQNNAIIVNTKLDSSYVSYPIVSLGNSNEDTKPIGVGINASDNGSLLMPQSISVFEFNGVTEGLGSPVLNTKIILGKLPDEKSIYGYAAGSYGLYAENVLLKGSLVTQANLQEGSTAYCGISTLYNEQDSPTSWAFRDNFKKTLIEKEVVDDFNSTGGNYYFRTIKYNSDDKPIVGEKYLVFWDEDEYTLECKKENSVIFLGNPSYVLPNGFDTGVPFALTFGSNFITIYTTDDAPQHTIQLSIDNTGEILLWAGAPGFAKEEVEAAKFFVDKNGNLFAGSGYFKGTIISDSTIIASVIETAVLRGSNKNPTEPALRIEDAAKGIHFTTSNDNGEIISVFEVTQDYIFANVPEFNINNNFKIRENGALVIPNLYITGERTNPSAENYQVIMIDKSKISYVTKFDENKLTGTTQGYIDFDGHLAFSANGRQENFWITEQEISTNVDFCVYGSIRYGENARYQPVYDSSNNIIGYDLYVE